jgi:O-antigen/teichoic acid export membrane protein
MSGQSEPLSQPEADPSDSSVRGRLRVALEATRGGDLKARTIRGASWTTIGFGAQQFLRLLSNLVLTRLLFPDAFGLMAIAQVFAQGLWMLSDIGVGASVVQNKRGDDPLFLSTAWTMQVIRGAVLCMGMWLLAYPVSVFYDQPILFPMLILLGTNSIIHGFQSIGVSTASRKMILSKLITIDLVSQICGLVMMISWAARYENVWALVVGAIVSSLVRVVIGYYYFRSEGNRFRFDRSAASEIFNFGKWIFLATAMTYIGGQGLRLLQGALVPIDVLGLIAIAGTLSLMARTLIGKLGSLVLFPAFSETQRENPERLRGQLVVVRRKLFFLSFPVYAVLIVGGDLIIRLLYDARYENAGSYLIVMATGAAISSLRVPFGMTLLAVGDAFGHSLNMSVMAATRIVFMVVGFAHFGIIGLLVADVLADFVVYPVEAWRLQRVKLWTPKFDLFCFLVYATLGATSIYLTVL